MASETTCETYPSSPLLISGTLRMASVPSLCPSYLASGHSMPATQHIVPWSHILWVLAPCILAHPPSVSVSLLSLSPFPSSLSSLPTAPLPAAPSMPHQNAPVCSALGLSLLPAFVSDPLSFMVLLTPPWREGQGEAWADQGGDLQLRGSTVGMGSGMGKCTGL